MTDPDTLRALVERIEAARDVATIYQKLAPHLEVVKGDGNPVAEPYGCYPPKRNGRHSLKDWPLHSWAGPGTSPLCVAWVAQSKRPPTFEQFLRVYGKPALRARMEGEVG